MKKIILILLISYSLCVYAVDGVVEINQTCAVNTGCFSGDAAGFPITIDGTAGNSYRLTGDLKLSNFNTIAIRIYQSDIRIDFNGFSVIGFGCNDLSVNCTPASGFSRAVFVTGSDIMGVYIGNGNVIGMASTGINLRKNSRVENMSIRWCGTGIQVGEGTVVSSNLVWESKSRGIYSSDDSIKITGNTVINNSGAGILVQDNNWIGMNLVKGNGLSGIKANDYNTVVNNQVSSNQIGIEVRNNALVVDNTINSNTSHGIFSFGNNHKILQNYLTDNSGYGIDVVGTLGVYQNNYMHNNTLGSTATVMTNMGGNYCHNQVCP